jgi:glucose/arabinose dehydrogenase
MKLKTIGASGLLAIMIAAAATSGGPSDARVSAVGADPIVTGLNVPAAFTLATDGRIFYGERLTGEVRIYNPANNSDTLFFAIPNVVASGEQGLLGVALAPGHPGRPFVYAYATRRVAGVDRNQILRIRDIGGTGGDMGAIWTSDVVASSIHNGGRIAFGPDAKLYAIVGEAGNPGHAQNLSNDVGKLLRFNGNGTIPPANPFPGSPIWAYGIRNSYGFGFDPMNGNIWQSENGPACNDELNRLQRGLNYGWGPNQTCGQPPPPPQNTNQDGPNPVLPQVWFTPTIAPTGVAFCVGCGIPSAEGAFFVGSFNDDRIRQANLNQARTQITSQSVVYNHSDIVLSLERGPDNAVYFSDSSRIWKLIEQ